MSKRGISSTLRPALLGLGLAAAALPALAQFRGPSSSQDPYLLPSQSGVETWSILTAGDSVAGYRMVGVPDGLGAWGDEDEGLAVLMNHELGPIEGAMRAHGSTGAFVSRWSLDPRDLAVLAGQDLTQTPFDVFTWDRSAHAWVPGTTAWNRFCSADLARKSAFFSKGLGSTARLYLKGEETRPPTTADHGRAFAHVVNGKNQGEAWELPHLGRMAYENLVASPLAQEKTIVVGLDDAAVSTAAGPLCTSAGQTGCTVPSEVYVYVGEKRKEGSEIERAGLVGGALHGVRAWVNGLPVAGESNDFGLGSGAYVGSGRFTLHSFGDVSGLSGNDLQSAAVAAGATRFQRPEDGVWDPRPEHEGDFYFVTTATATTNSRLWRLRFDDVHRPELGGTIVILLRGDEGHRMLDNLTMDRLGRLVLLEDVGSNVRLGKVWLYVPETGRLIEVAAHRADLFAPGSPGLLTIDEEASGVIDAADLLGEGMFLLDSQVHRASPDPELVEGGQLLALYIPPALGRE